MKRPDDSLDPIAAVRAAVPQASRVAMAGPFAVAVGARDDGLLHIRHLEEQRFPEEYLAVLDLPSRPPRGFWSDAVIAAAREQAPEGGADVVVSGAGDAPLATSAELVLASLDGFGGGPAAAEVAARALAFLRD